MENTIPVIRVIGGSAPDRVPSVTRRLRTVQIRRLAATPRTQDDPASTSPVVGFGGVLDVLEVRLVR